MTDLVRYQPPTSSLDLAPQAWKLAEKIAMTDFVPPALRDKPEAVLACILAGHEAGVSPMQALSKIHIIEGRPAMASELMRALVLQHGHELNYSDVSTTSVTAEGKRKGSERWTRVTWTMDDAKRGGLDGKTTWRRWPRAMLLARATAELCRMIFPDVLAGISHTVEELSDGNVSDDLVDFGPPEIVMASAPAAPPANRAKAGRAVTRQSAPAAEIDEKDPPPAGEIPALPGDEIADAELVEDAPEISPADSSEIIDAEVIEPPPAPELPPEPPPAAHVEEDDWPAGEWTSGDFPSDPPPADARRFTGPQLVAIRLGDRFGIKGNTAEARAERLRAIAVILGREIESSKDLSPAEISTVIERIDAWPADRPLFAEEAPPAATVAPEAPEAPLEPSAPHTEAEEPRRRPTPARPAARPIYPDQWTGEEWREILANRKVKVTELLREAQRLGATREPAVSIPLLDMIAGSGLAEELLGWVEDLSLERRSK